MSSGDYLLRDEPKVMATVKKYSMNYSGKLIDSNQFEQLKSENEQLKEMLRKCSPMTGDSGNCCLYCNAINDGITKEEHKPNCEYVKMIGGVE